MSRSHVELIAAVGPHWELGFQGGMPWGKVKGDLAHFAAVTRGKAVIMGRRTWESLPPAHRPLKGRLNVVLSRDVLWSQQQPLLSGVMFMAGSGGLLDYAIKCARSEQPGGGREVVIIGGGEVYRAALEADVVDVIHLSVIPRVGSDDPLQGSLDALWPHDVTFPALHPRGWALTPNGSSPRFAERREPEDGAPHGWRYAQLVRNPLQPALSEQSDGVPMFWGGCGGW